MGFVRWTAQRNFSAILQMIAEGKLQVSKLISHTFAFDEALKAYQVVTQGSPMGIILDYKASPGVQSHEDLIQKSVALNLPSFKKAPVQTSESIVVGVLGAGNFASRVLLPAFAKTGARLKTLVSSAGITGTHFGKKFGFESSSTDPDSIFSDEQIHTVVIATRHDSHAGYVIKAIESGKDVFVEKPLCLTMTELKQIEQALASSSCRLMVGFNRRFSPLTQKMKLLLSSIEAPKAFVMTVNAGFIKQEHWTQDEQEGGGRILGEACHFVDLLRFLSGSAITQINQTVLAHNNDTVTLQLTFADGSMGTIHYFANGSKDFPKERLEAFALGKVLQLNNFRTLFGYGFPHFSKMSLWHQNKGHNEETIAFIKALQDGGSSPIPLTEIMEVTRCMLSLKQNPPDAVH